ncbi:MAG: TrkH family potassium uptake protein [Thermoflexales bacterium]
MPAPWRIVGSLALIVLIGTALLLLPFSSAERPLTPPQAFFTAVSALSVTGLSVIAPGRDLSLFGQLVLLGMIQIGGVGFMVVAVVVLRVLGRAVALEDRLALRDSLGLINLAEIVQLTGRSLVVIALVELAGAVLLWLHWRTFLPLSEFRVMLYALFHAVSAFCNAGFDLFGGSPQFPGGLPKDSLTLTLLALLILIGGLGIPVIADLINWPRYRTLSLHTRLTLVTTATLSLVGTALMFISETLSSSPVTMEQLTPLERLGIALFQAISARTAGYASFEHLEQISAGSRVTLMVLMFVGAAPASMGGGITTGTFAVLVIAAWSFLRGLPVAQVSHRTIDALTLRRASTVMIVALALVSTATYLVAITNPQVSLDRVLFEVVSAFATCGLSLALTEQLNVFGQLVIAVVMFWGRLGTLTLVTAVTALSLFRRKHLVGYPEAHVLIG